MNNPQRQSMIGGFGGLPFGEVSQCGAGQIAVLGVPSEVKNGPRSGTSLAPDALRKMAGQLGTALGANGCDLGNLDMSADWSGVLAQLVKQLVDNDVMPVVLGGASDVAITVLRTLPDLPVVAAIPLAQSDLSARTADTTWLGLNGGQPADVWDQIEERRMAWRTARQLDEGQTEFTDIPERAILWIDISVIDLGHAAGAVGLNPGGMKPETLASAIGAMPCRWQAIVVSGLASAYDTRGMSELAVIETLSAALCRE